MTVQKEHHGRSVITTVENDDGSVTVIFIGGLKKRFTREQVLEAARNPEVATEWVRRYSK